MRLWAVLLFPVLATACRDVAGVAVTPPAFTTLRGATFTLAAVDGRDLPTEASFPWPTDSGETLVPFSVRGGTLVFSPVSDSALMWVGPLDPLRPGDPPAWFGGAHRIGYVTRDSVTFDAFTIGVVTVGPSAVARLHGDTLRMASIPVITYVPSGFPGLVPGPRLPFYGVHTWLFVRSRS